MKFCAPPTSHAKHLPNSVSALTLLSSDICNASFTIWRCVLFGCSAVKVELGASFTAAECSLSYSCFRCAKHACTADHLLKVKCLVYLIDLVITNTFQQVNRIEQEKQLTTTVDWVSNARFQYTATDPCKDIPFCTIII